MILPYKILSFMHHYVENVYALYTTRGKSVAKIQEDDRGLFQSHSSLLKLYRMTSISERKSMVEFEGEGSMRYPCYGEYIASMSYYLNASLDFNDSIEELESCHTHETSTAHITLSGELFEGYEILRKYTKSCNTECIGFPLLLYNVVDQSYLLLYKAWISDIHVTYDITTYTHTHTSIHIDAYADTSRADDDVLGIAFVPFKT